MDKYTIIKKLAEGRQVETIVSNIAHRDLTSELRDLCQMVYVILLEYDDDKIIDLYDNGYINQFIVRIVLNQYRSRTSTFYNEVRRFADLSDEIGERDFAEGK